MTHDDRTPESIRSAITGYNAPPELKRADLDAMWSRIEGQAFDEPRIVTGASPRARRFAHVFTASNLLPLAAVLVIGVAIGRFALPRSTAPATQVAVTADPVQGTSIDGPYQSTASRYLGQATALLASLPTDVNAANAGEPYKGRAHDLLLTTRLLLDSPAAADPRFRTLLEDLELVLAQVVRLQSAESSAELELIRQALEQRDVLPRLRTAVADISADD
jgi:hypothetical protein